MESLAQDYGIPLVWVRCVLYPENDLDARYGRKSDRHERLKERAAEAEAESAALREVLRKLRDALRAQNIDGCDVWNHWIDDDGSLHRECDALLETLAALRPTTEPQ